MTDQQAAVVKQELETIVFGLTHPQNKCWPTTRPWTRKERDQALLNAARKALAVMAGDATSSTAAVAS